METYQREFIELALANEVLKFGEFTLKSGRLSPYFFNAGQFYTGAALDCLGRCYAQAIINSGLEYDVVFGPAYKGIPLASAIVVALHNMGVDKPYAFNRKEAKDHGEGGSIVGAELTGKRILIVDDVITAGSAIREVMVILEQQQAEPAGIVLGLNRQERGLGELSAVQEVERQFHVPVVSIIGLDTIEQHLLVNANEPSLLAKISQYRQDYGEQKLDC